LTHWIVTHLNYFFAHYGYWTVFVGILLESAGVPLPGETILILASVFARTQHRLNIVEVAIVALIAAVTGDNIGFAVGHYGGRPMLDRYRHAFHVEAETISRGEALFARHGGMTVYFARFVAALRVLAGPLAGVLRMPWRKFLMINALGAMSWVALITTLAYILGPSLEPVLRHVGWTLAGIVVFAAAVWWMRWRRPGEKKPR
jgi:membrane protein DedA with SNARE-associated domain